MDRSLYTDEIDESLKFIFAYFVDDVFDDPSTIDWDKSELEKIERVGRFLGVDIWDRERMRQLGFSINDSPYAKLMKLAGRE